MNSTEKLALAVMLLSAPHTIAAGFLGPVAFIVFFVGFIAFSIGGKNE